MEGRALVRLAQLRGRVAVLARGGRFDLAGPLLGELVRADLALGLPADGLLRARQAAQVAEARGEPLAAPLVVLAAALLAADDPEAAADAAALAVGHAASAGDDRARLEMLGKLVGGAAHRRAGRPAMARPLLDGARAAASGLGATGLAGLALSELASVDLVEDHAAGAAVCFEFAAEYFRRANQPRAAVEAGALAVTSRLRAGELAAASELAPRIADAARAVDRPDLVAYVDGALADAALASARGPVREAPPNGGAVGLSARDPVREAPANGGAVGLSARGPEREAPPNGGAVGLSARGPEREAPANGSAVGLSARDPVREAPANGGAVGLSARGPEREAPPNGGAVRSSARGPEREAPPNGGAVRSSAHDAAVQACALAAESAEALPDSALARDLRAQARLRQARTASDDSDRARHLEAGIELAVGLPHVRGGMLLVGHLIALLEAGGAEAEVARVSHAIMSISRGDAELAALARLVAEPAHAG